MHILLFGATGRVGRLVFEEALSRGSHFSFPFERDSDSQSTITGHTVTALVRNPAALQSRDGLTIVKGIPVKLPSVGTLTD